MRKKDKINLIMDIICLVVYLVVANPAWTGIGVHEWLSLAVFVVLFVHVLFHMDWVIKTTKLAFTKPSWVTTGNWVLNTLLAISLVLCTISGLLISGDVLPAFGMYATGYYFWDPLHAFSAKLLLALIIVHVVIHWRWIFSWFKKTIGKDERAGEGADADAGEGAGEAAGKVAEAVAAEVAEAAEAVEAAAAVEAAVAADAE